MASDTRVKRMLPKAENFLRLANRNIVNNRRLGHEATVSVPGLISRAYIIVNETADIEYRDAKAFDSTSTTETTNG